MDPVPTPSAPRTVVVLGANGRFGAAAAHAFAAAGWRVLAQARRPLADAPPGALRLDAAPSDTAAFVRAAGGRAHLVVHALNPPYERWRDEALPLAHAAIDVARSLGATLLLPGNVYVFGRTMPASLDEDTPQRADTVKGRIRVELEAALRDAASRGGPRAIVLRAGDFFGGGAGAWFDLVLLRGIARGRFVYPGPLDVPHAWAYLPDLAAACVRLADRAERMPPFTTLHFPGYAPTGRELADAVQAAARRLGVLAPDATLRIGALPWRTMRLLSPLVRSWRELLEIAYLWRIPHRLDGARLAALLDEVPSTPLADAVEASLAALVRARRPIEASAAAT